MKILCFIPSSLLLLVSTQRTQAQSLAHLAATTPGFSSLAVALDAADLLRNFQSEWYCRSTFARYFFQIGLCRTYTVFAPTNDAFDALPNELLTALITDSNYQPLLANILLYHAIPDVEISSNQITTTSVKSANGQRLPFSFTSSGSILVDGVNVIEPFDVQASNGILHTAESVLLPAAAQRTIVDIALNNPNFSLLVEAVVKTNLVDTLSTGLFTVFAPTNAAFEAAFTALSINSIDDIEVGMLTEILLYHVIPNAVVTKDRVPPSAAVPTALEGTALQVRTQNSFIRGRREVVLNGSINVVLFDVLALNGVVHAIDGVLLPPS